MFLFVVFAVLLVILLIVAPISGVMSGGTSMLAVPPKNKNLQLVVVGEALEPPGAFRGVGTACTGQKRIPKDADVNRADTSLEDAVCPILEGYQITNCGQLAGVTDYHLESGAVDFVPDSTIYARVYSPVDGIVTYCHTTRNCGCGDDGGGAIMLYSGGHYYLFMHVYPRSDICERAESGEIVYVSRGEQIIDGLYEGVDSCTTGPHIHLEITTEDNKPAYDGEACRFLVEKCGSPWATDCPSVCQ